MQPCAKRPLHEQIPILQWPRRPARRVFFTLLRKASQTDDGKAIAVHSLKGLLPSPPKVLAGPEALTAMPYPDLGRTAGQASSPALRTDVIFLTARFRSGSTLLWNLFRNLDGCTSYYEPLNERQWFNPEVRGDYTDVTHRHVSEYWREYEGLEELGKYYREEWISRNLLMDEDFWDPDLKRYVELLIDRAPGRPVLQFNRIDFRLPWFRRHFPAARVVHLYRHPRDQWCSALGDLERFPPDADKAEFVRQDGFYLLTWARDLRYHFPFLDEEAVSHPYRLFYYIWKLSYLFGRKYAHYSLAFEHLLADPAGQLEHLFRALAVKPYDLDRLKRLIAAPQLGRWREYADDGWFRRHEEACEAVLAEFLGPVPTLPAAGDGAGACGPWREPFA